MTKIDALEIWEKLEKSKLCKDAVAFYQSNGMQRNIVLDRGSVDFDSPATNDINEKPLYRAATYIARDYSRDYDGYMNMHIKQNTAAFSFYLKNIVSDNRNILFVDFGCGPMTAGLALAQHLSKKDTHYRKRAFYAGIDRSANMCRLAQKINKSHEVFEDNHFLITQGHDLDLSKISFQPDIAILNMSYVLSPKTFRSGNHPKNTIINNIAETWTEHFSDWVNCQTVVIIYHNPAGGFHEHWETFGNSLKQLGKSNGIKYDIKEIRDCSWNGARLSKMAMIKGTRKAES